MTTSDDEPVFEDQDRTLDDETTTHAEPADGDAPAAPVASGKAKRWTLAILAALAAATAGVVAWALIYMQFKRPYVGVSILIGLTVGWFLRALSGTSGMPTRILAVLITAAGCVAGTVVSEVAFTAKSFRAGFWPLLRDVVPDTWEIVSNRPGMTYAIFGAALLLAYLSAGPQSSGKPKKQKKAQPAGVAPVDTMAADPLADPMDVHDPLAADREDDGEQR